MHPSGLRLTARSCLSEGSLHSTWKIGDGLAKSAQIGRIDEAGRVKLTLREDPQGGVNLISFKLASLRGRAFAEEIVANQ